MKVVDVFFPPLPTTLAPTDYVRRWDHAFVLGAVVFAITALVCAVAWSRPLGLGPIFIFWGVLAHDEYFWAQATSVHYAAVATTWLVSGGLAAVVFKASLRPYNHERHIRGHQFRNDVDEAVIQAGIQAKEIMGDQEPWMHLHPAFPIPKVIAVRGFFIVGSMGGGKTEILKSWLVQHFDRKRRTLIYDLKGDFVSLFLHYPNCRLFSPWDERSVHWDIARDINTKDRAVAFANGFFPPSSNDGKIWNDGAALIFSAILIEIMREHETNWGWDTINRWISMSHAELVEKLQRDHPLAVKAMAKEGSNTASSMEMTLGIGVQMIADLAQAWNRSNRSERFSWHEWMTNARISQRQIIVKAGPDKKSTTALMGGIFNYLANAIQDSSVLPEDLLGRSLVFFIDELGTIGRFDLDRMIVAGRSKGCVIAAATQDMAQLDVVYGKELRKTIESNLNTKIYCQVSMGDTRKELAEMFGYRHVASLLPQYTFSNGGKSVTSSVKSEPRAVVDATDLTDLIGPRRTKKYPSGYAIRAVLSCGREPLLLEWGGVKMPTPNEPAVPASWTKRPMKHKTFRQLYGVMGTDYVRDRQALRRVIELFEQHNAQRRQAPKALDQWKANLGAERA
ncbi:type IV secretory system conjugative DNA transfer family protein [Pseudoxanthomonas winnipegensis]|uniref:type IV secretory system conjugative DNA transfer family protein n=1 Tax=Pseudoxanthomonas winnipegensis TaxID=2480810 RepID=UPI00104073C9|nr:type IV secretion system DNA-binding domain-containing protein [Pseudoxanthomonas winnipegensis]TBV69365.1 hypothetical protein EYC45_19575 [Pseudoxanthomonas winnipegensis]